MVNIGKLITGWYSPLFQLKRSFQSTFSILVDDDDIGDQKFVKMFGHSLPLKTIQQCDEVNRILNDAEDSEKRKTFVSIYDYRKTRKNEN